MSKIDGFDDLTGGQLKALCIKLGGMDVVTSILRGEMGIELRELIRKLVDKNGRMIPMAGMESSVCDPNTSFKLIQPEIDYAERLNRLINFFSDMEFLSAEEFKGKSEVLLEQLRQDNFLSNLLNGVWLPVCFPRFTIGDYGEDLEKVFLKAAGDSYKNQFPKREFSNYCEGELKGKVSLVQKSRHDQLLAKMAEGPVVGIQFFPFRGFSINADRELMASLPESLLLSGPVDIATAMTAYPDVLARDFSTPGCDCAAVSWRSSAHSLYFKATGGKLKFGSTGNLGHARGASSASLVFLG